METSFTKLVGCRLPLQQAGMGGIAGAELAIAVADSGALGMIGLAGLPLEIATAVIAQVASSTSGVFGVNFLIPFLDRDVVMAAAASTRLVEFFYGEPDVSLVSLVHEQGALACWQVGSAGEAAAACDAGCDLIVVQGSEGGGHVRGSVGLLPLLDQILGTVEVPVVAAGGIGGPRAIAAVIAAGAAAARVGTRFVVAEEADVHDDYAKALLGAEAEDTEITTTFGSEWPDAPHRVLKSSIDSANASEEETVAEVGLPGGLRMAVPRLSVMPAGRSTIGNVAAMAQYAGQSVAMVRRRQPAAEIVHELVDGAERLLAQLS